MSLYAATPCGRYGKAHGEPFLRRRTNLEPVDTPRKYYRSNYDYQEGIAACNAAWQVWKQERYGTSAQIRKTPYFELVDQELKAINSLIQSGSFSDFQRGLSMLENRITASRRAGESLKSLQRQGRYSREHFEELLNQERRAPPALVKIFDHLQMTWTPAQFDAMRKLERLCYWTCRLSSERKSTNLPRAGVPSTSSVEDPIAPTAAIHPQGEEFGLGHDPGEQKGVTIIQDNMFAPSVEPAGRLPKPTPYPGVLSNVKVRDFAYSK